MFCYEYMTYDTELIESIIAFSIGVLLVVFSLGGQQSIHEPFKN